MMKKARDVKETRKNNQNLFKYVNASRPIGFPLQSKTHTRSMMDLDPNIRYQQSAREMTHHNKQNHQLSLCNHTEEHESEVKSNSLKKFLSLFGTNSSTNPILNPSGNNLRLSTGKQQRQTSRSGRQVFTCNIKNMNVNVNNSKQREHNEQKSTLILKKEKTDASNISQMTNQLKMENQQLKLKLKSINQQFNSISQALKDRINLLEGEIVALKKENSNLKDEKLVLQQKFALRERSLQKTIQNLEKNISKQKCREHDLIIQSLKKVINQQLRKIIELQKFKIERQQIQKLEERINKNMPIKTHEAIQRNPLMEVKELICLSRRDEPIKITDENSFSQSALTSERDSRFQMIEQAEENEQFSRRSEQDGDSILEEVDKYLVQWRNKH